MAQRRKRFSSGGFGGLKMLVGVVLLAQVSLPPEPTVRIGVERNVGEITLRSPEPFTLDGRTVRSATFSTVIAISGAEATVQKDDLETRLAIELDSGAVLIRPMDLVLSIRPGDSPLEVGGKSYRGDIEVRGTSRGLITVINELPMEQYLLGVVPNELAPDVFPELEALKAQAIAARTYIVRNLGQFEAEGFDICATDFCQVYRGRDTEHPLATQAVEETRGMIATFAGEPINALYSSTCGGRTENAENVFGEAVPYLVSTVCEYRHPEPQAFGTSTVYGDWEEGLLGIADVETFSDAGRFLGLTDVGEPTSMAPAELATFIRSRFFPRVRVASDLGFLEDQGILLPTGHNDLDGVILRLLERKNVFEWQSARLMSWDGEVMKVRIGPAVENFGLSPTAAIFQRVAEERIPVGEGAWLGGESMDIRVIDGQVEALVYRPNSGIVSADRYSPLVQWQTHRSREELDEAIAPLGIGLLEDIRVLARGLSERVVRVEFNGTRGRRVIAGPRLRTLLGLRDSLVYLDEERNARRELLGMTFYGGGWGHGVGMCQVGAYGMAMDGATAEEILTTYYRGIEVEQVY